MRMMSLSCSSSHFPLRNGMLLRWVHLNRQILAACPVAPEVCSFTQLQALHVC